MIEEAIRAIVRDEIEKQQGAPTLVDASPAEPAPGSDAEHPPVGYRLAKKGDLRQKGYIWWDSYEKIWELSACYNTGMPVDMETGDVVANPIPANEGDGMVESLADRVADSIADEDALRSQKGGAT